MIQFTAQQIAAMLGAALTGDPNRAVTDVAPLETAQEQHLSYITDEKYLPLLNTTHAGVLLVTQSLAAQLPAADCPSTIIWVDNARGAMAQLLSAVAEALNPRKHGVEQPAYISDDVHVPDDAYIGAFAYIGKGVRLGKGVQIYPQTYIGDYAVIGDNTLIYPGVRIYHHCRVGRDCILHAGVVIGADGFGFEPDAQGVNQKVPQIGAVIIEDDVEIGANTTIDRAMMGNTIVHRNAKLDNLVQVAHNVQVGESTFLCAQVGIAGSSAVGDHCVLAGQVGVAGHITIADNTVFGAQSGVAGNVRQPGKYMGYPAIDAARWRRAVVGFKNLPEMMNQLNKLHNQQ